MDFKETFKQNAGFRYATIIVVAAMIFGGGFFIGKSSVIQNVCKPENINFSLFWDAYNKLKDHFIDPSKITDQQVIYGAIKGMTQGLGDPYTDFFSPQDAKLFQQDLSGSFDGIGVEVGSRKDRLTVISPLKGSPGEKAGLMPGDIITQIDGKSTADLSTDQAVDIIRGKKGTKVTLTIFREGWSNTKDFTIVRDTIKVDSMEWSLKDGDTAYISIHEFNQPLAADFKKAAMEILNSPAKRIVLDLRNDPGGYLEICQDVAGWFLKPGQVVALEDFGTDKDQQIYKAEGNGALANYPLVVLINRGSASASEILAGALRDNRGVQLVGEKSFGKGSVQELVNLQDGQSLLKVTIAKWLTPKGVSISEVGLTPDIKVDISEEDIAAKKDPQLDKALEIVKGLK